MPEDKLDSKKIAQNGWKQGAILEIRDGSKVIVSTQCKAEELPKGLYVILSQDCDILNEHLEKECVVELIHANKIAQCNPELSSGKNPRQLHLEIENCCLEIFPDWQRSTCLWSPWPID